MADVLPRIEESLDNVALRKLDVLLGYTLGGRQGVIYYFQRR